MSYAENLGLFFSLLVDIIIVPGMDMLFVIASSLSGGRRAGLSATAGIMASGAVHTLYGALGTGLLAQLLPSLFHPLLIAGAAYMVWIGWSLMRSAITIDHVEIVDSRSSATAFRRGALTCLLNPKAYLFVIAVYPQFLTPAYGPIWRQALVMGAMTAAVQLVVYGGLAVAAGKSRAFLIGSPHATIIAGRAVGLLLVLVACLTLWRGWSY